MSSGIGTSLSWNAGPTRQTTRRLGAGPSMYGRQTHAYLCARDVLRRFRRNAALGAPSPEGMQGLGDRSAAACGRDRKA